MLVRLLIVLFLSSFTNPSLIHYQIKKGSKMVLKGKTSVKDFNCACDDTFENAQLIARINNSTRQIDFDKANFNVKIKSLDCSNKFINNDLATSLKAEKHPFINVEMLTAVPNHQEQELQVNKAYKYCIKTLISISGKTKPQTLNVTLKKINAKNYIINACKVISMSDYEIQPKSPIKFIKIKDEVRIEFNLNVEIQ
ncbi:YceI family protein [Lacihabitans soyangensis]|uniref:YceI family protein n=1 Tax=Lacihabitans soyangensis TaxID=869394 RepID=A0AAE3H7C3_9BACT|nr:YceI family protein [Lacihabitans soyangensis]MCP9764370.1 YceI family protein [Lacihabitans soyangensis]